MSDTILTLAEFRVMFAASLNAVNQGIIESVVNEGGHSTIVSSYYFATPQYKSDHFVGAWVHLRDPQRDLYVTAYDNETGTFVLDRALAGPNDVGNMFDLFTRFTTWELNRALRLALTETRLQEFDAWVEAGSRREMRLVNVQSLFDASQVDGVWIRETAPQGDGEWYEIGGYELLNDGGDIILRLRRELPPDRAYRVRISYQARYKTISSPDDLMTWRPDDNATIAGDLNWQLAKARERLWYLKLVSCSPGDREFYGMMLNDAREDLKTIRSRPRHRSIPMDVEGWQDYGYPI